MNLSTVWEDNVCTIGIDGQIDTLTAPELETVINDAAPRCETMVLDMSKVDYISSGGLRVIVGANHTYGKEKFILRGLAPNVFEIFRLTGFTNYLNIEE